MIQPEHIPEEAWQAAMLSYTNNEAVVDMLCAALNAWPGGLHTNMYGVLQGGAFVLPLPKEAGDAQ